jgi:hypothetical protein
LLVYRTLIDAFHRDPHHTRDFYRLHGTRNAHKISDFNCMQLRPNERVFLEIVLLLIVTKSSMLIIFP